MSAIIACADTDYNLFYAIPKRPEDADSEFRPNARTRSSTFCLDVLLNTASSGSFGIQDHRPTDYCFHEDQLINHQAWTFLNRLVATLTALILASNHRVQSKNKRDPMNVVPCSNIRASL